MVHDVDDVAVWCSDEEPAHTPWLCSYRVYDLAAEFLSFFISTFDVIRVDGNDRVFGCGCITRHELDVRPRGGRGVAGHPSHVELLGTQPEVVGVEALRCLNVSHPKVGHNPYDVHAVLLPTTDVHDDPPNAAACRLVHSGHGCSPVAHDGNYRARPATHSIREISAPRVADSGGNHPTDGDP